MENKTLYNFFAGNASDTEKRAIKMWVDEDIAHKKTLLKERAFYDALMLADDEQLKENAETSVRKIHVMFKQSMKWAAVIAITFISSYLLFNLQLDDWKESTNTIVVPSGQRVNLALSDGTKVCLNAGTTFTYPSLFASDSRNVSLNGEAYFEVSANKEKPFIVHTSACDVKVLGTKFNVDAYEKENKFSAALMEGKIAVRNNENPANELYMTANQKVTLNHGDLEISRIEDYDIYRWKEGLLCFKNLDFISLMKRIEKYYDVVIVVQDMSYATFSFSGKFRISDGIESLLRVLQKDVHYTFTRSEDGSTIYIK